MLENVEIFFFLLRSNAFVTFQYNRVDPALYVRLYERR